MANNPRGFSTNLGLALLPEIDQKKYPDVFAELQRMRGALASLQNALDKYTGALGEDPTYWDQAVPGEYLRAQNISRYYCKCSEAITLAQTVNFHNVAGVPNARKANATDNTKPCVAYCNGTFAAGDMGEFILFGLLPYISGLTSGTRLFLHTTSGQFTSTPPAGAGKIVQPLGMCIGPTSIWFNPTLNWTQL